MDVYGIYITKNITQQADTCPRLAVLELDDADLVDGGLAAIARALKHGPPPSHLCVYGHPLAHPSSSILTQHTNAQGTAPTSRS